MTTNNGVPVPAVSSVDGVDAVTLDMAEVAKHNTANSCFLVIKGAVYDVSSFISQHPGGARRITEVCGQEVTGIFASIHSNFAWNLLGDYFIGNLGSSVNVQSAAAEIQTNTANTGLSGKQNRGRDHDEDDDEFEFEFEDD